MSGGQFQAGKNSGRPGLNKPGDIGAEGKGRVGAVYEVAESTMNKLE